MKIDNSIKPLTSTGVTETRGKTSNAKPASKTASAQEKVDINPLSSQLQALESSLDKVSVVDAGRVEAIKQAISEGRFKVNADVVADRLLSTVKEMVLNQKG